MNGRTLTLVLSVMALGCAKGLTPPTPTTMVTISDPTLLTYDFGTTTMCKEGEELDETSACTVGKEVVETFPKMTVSLTPFSIDIHEVTNVQYRHCVAKGNCTDPQFDSTEGIGRYYNDTNGTYDHYPVVFVTWDQADKYCRSVGKRLPTEYEWERVATLGETTHPWGNTISDCKNKDIAIAGCNGNFNTPRRVTASKDDVVKLPNGSGELFDMGGNVREWVQDVYKPKVTCKDDISTAEHFSGGGDPPKECKNAFECSGNEACQLDASKCSECKNGTKDCHAVCESSSIKFWICIKFSEAQTPSVDNFSGPRAIRGGSFFTSSNGLCQARPRDRSQSEVQSNAHSYLGFRCAKDAN